MPDDTHIFYLKGERVVHYEYNDEGDCPNLTGPYDKVFVYYSDRSLIYKKISNYDWEMTKYIGKTY